MRYKTAFTLVELLVVITIIALLLAMLTPAMDRAIYQAELAVCGTNVRAIAQMAQIYAMDHQRWYPYRSGVNSGNDLIDWWPDRLRDPRDGGLHDDRDEIAGYVDINKHLNCPLVGDVDLTLNGTAGTNMIQANYELYYGWGYRRSTTVHPPAADRNAPGKGMMKLGDTWESDPGDNGRRYPMKVIAADVEYVNFNANNAWSSHPDRLGVLGEMIWQNYGDAGYTPGEMSETEAASAAAFGALIGYPAVSMTWSRWDARFANASINDASQSWRRGELDRNFGYIDGSVQRLDGIKIHPWAPDERMIFTSQNATAYNTLHNKHLPRP